MSTNMTETKHTEQLRAPMLEIIIANVAHTRGFMEDETSYHALHGLFRCDSFGASLGDGGGEGLSGYDSSILWAPCTRSGDSSTGRHRVPKSV